MIEPGETAESRTLPPGVYCPSCSYDLRGATEDRCSECGYSLAGLRSSASGIPWSHRKKLGRFKTYWQTVWMVTFKNRRFCEEYAKKVDYLDARKFQCVTVLHVVAATVGAIILSVAFGYINPAQAGSPWESLMEFAGIPVTVWSEADRVIWQNTLFFSCTVLFVVASAGVPSYLFHPAGVSPERQNSGIALSHYACAPLSIAALPLGAIEAAYIHGCGVSGCVHVQAYLVSALCTGLYIVLSWWLNLVRQAKRTMPHISHRAVLVGVVVPLVWLILGFVVFLGVPFLLVSALILIASLR